MKLSAADLLTLRTKWIDDYVNDHAEIGRSAVTSSPAVSGATSLALGSLGIASGTVYKGTVLLLTVAGRFDRYSVTADATITTSTATVYVAPALLSAVPGSTAVQAEPYYQSLFNKARAGENNPQFFTDDEIGELADRAESMWGQRIATSRDPQEFLFRGIRLLANQAKMDSSDFHAAVRAMARERFDVELDKIDRRINEDRKAVESQTYGPRSWAVSR